MIDALFLHTRSYVHMSKKDTTTTDESLPDTETIVEEPQDAPIPSDADNDSGVDAALDDATGIDDAVTQLEDQLKEYKEKHLRLAAEFDNYKKRMARQFDSVVKTANDSLIIDTLESFDNFERALDTAKSQDDYDGFHKGVEMIFKQLQDVLKKRGVTVMDAAGKEFDPNMHEAIMMVEDAKVASDHIVNVVQKGYTCDDRVIRAAKVTVNK